MGVPLLEGRDFNAADTASSALVMMVNQAFAQRYSGGGSPLGRKVRVFGKDRRIVGLVRNIKRFRFGEAPQPHFYLPFAQGYYPGQNIVSFVRGAAGDEQAAAVMRREAAALDANASAVHIAPRSAYNRSELLPQMLTASLLSGLGLFGVLSFVVSQRTQKMGIRRALGAQTSDVVRAVVGQGLRLAGRGIPLGLGLTALLARTLGGVLAGVSPFDPVAFGGAVLFLVLVAALASYLPARRAAGVAPLTALRCE